MAIQAFLLRISDRNTTDPALLPVSAAGNRGIVIRRLFQSRPKVLDPLDAYELWAATYDDREGNALLHAEQRTVYPLLQEMHLSNKCVLDAGCGTGRYLELLREFKPRLLAGIDFAPSMLKVAK